jgi:hypothetical protein
MTPRTPRARKATDFTVDVDNVGQFVFGKRTMGDELAIHREYSDILQGVENPTNMLDILGNWLSTLRVLTVSAPAVWDLDELDPLAEDTFVKLKAVFDALSAKELSFRGGQKPPGEATSA